MTFSEIIPALKEGKKASRKKWVPYGEFLFLFVNEPLHVVLQRDPVLKKEAESNGWVVPGLPTTCRFRYDDDGKKIVFAGGLASLMDMLSDDWFVIGEK